TTLHNITPHTGDSWPFKLATRLILGLSQKAIVHSRRNARQLETELRQDPDNILILPMGAPDYRRGRKIDRAASRQHLGLPTERPILLMFGALRDYKGLDVALKALRSLIDAVPQALLLVAGQAWLDRDEHDETVKRMGLTANVRLDLDYIPDELIHHYFSAADLLLLPYLHFDAQSGVGVAALPYGLPAVVSDCGSLPELVRDPGSVVRPSDAQQLATRIAEILGSPALHARLAADATELGRHHDWPSIARDLSRQTNDLIAKQREGQKG
ncbi:MAG: glycosyltransferase, partial [Sedimenticolaceae bacterium]